MPKYPDTLTLPCGTVDPLSARFSTLATIDGFEVIDADGRCVAERQTGASANGVAYTLNRAADSGPKALAAILSAGAAHDYRGGR